MKTLTSDDLAAADDGSYYTIAGCGGPLEAWVEGYQKVLGDQEVGTPTEWFQTTGANVNLYAAKKMGATPRHEDMFKDDLTILMFPLTDLNVPRLAVVKLQMEDRWFDDIIANIRPRP